jgi:uroporphyrin-III C-methyltransferase/precorrin-2 dehydrogenase/sirohydrochlorin ferrochelatase
MADPYATTVIYMARATLAGFRDRAVAAGLDPQTPAVAVLAATRPDEVRVAATIATLPDMLGQLPAKGPVLVLVGHALGAVAATGVSQDLRRA